MGIALQPEFIVVPYLKKKKLQHFLEPFEDEHLGIYAVLLDNRYVPHRVHQ